jgi:hypothetical protein
MMSRAFAALAFLFSFATSAQAIQVCAWMVETNQPDDLHNLDVWVQSDHDLDVFYQLGGDGIVTPSGTSNSPGSGTYSFTAGKPEKPWGFGSTLDGGGKIDVIFELHKMPADIFSDAPKPLLAKFVFRRNVPDGEKKIPLTLAKKQCVTIAAP